MSVTVEIAKVALRAGTAITAVDCGIAIAVDANSSITVGWVMTGCTAGVDRSDEVAGMAVYA